MDDTISSQPQSAVRPYGLVGLVLSLVGVTVIAGLALFHREPLNASWGRSLIKAVLELEPSRADLESVNPEA
jgi:hypothetical protein